MHFLSLSVAGQLWLGFLCGRRMAPVHCCHFMLCRDEVYSSYLRWLKTFGAATTIHTNNQVLSLTDQLNLGVRVVELDVHYVAVRCICEGLANTRHFAWCAKCKSALHNY